MDMRDRGDPGIRFDVDNSLFRFTGVCLLLFSAVPGGDSSHGKKRAEDLDWSVGSGALFHHAVCSAGGLTDAHHLYVPFL